MKKKTLKHLAFRPERSVGRRSGLFRTKIEARKCFEEDIQRVLRSASFLRAGLRKQVFDSTVARINSRGGHMIQTQEVALRLAEKLGLCRTLCTAIGLAHDIGQPPFSHTGEILIREFLPEFRHESFGVVLAQEIEPLDLTYEVLSGILNHSFGSGVMEDPGAIREHRLVALGDKISYTFYDVGDFGFIAEYAPGLMPVPPAKVRSTWREIQGLVEPFGLFQDKYYWIDRCVDAVVEESLEVGDVSFSHSQLAQCFKDLRGFMYKEVYGPLSNPEREKAVIREVIKYLYGKNVEHDPLMLTALMVDSQVQALHRLICGESLLSFEWGGNLDELLHSLVRWDFNHELPKEVNLTEADLSWATTRS